MKSGSLITFSGLDGAGKSTQVELLRTRLIRGGGKPVCLWTRGGYTPWFEKAKSLFRRVAGCAVPPPGDNPERARALTSPRIRQLWLTIALMDLAWAWCVKIRWWLWMSRPVICDRYVWDTLVDFRLNFPDEDVESWRLWRGIARLSPNPETAFLILVPVEESSRRSDLKGEPFRDTLRVLEERLHHYESLAQQGLWHVLDGRRPAGTVAEEVVAILSAAAAGPSGRSLPFGVEV